MKRLPLIPRRAWVQSAILLCAVSSQALAAQDATTIARAFADHCFSPYLTAAKAEQTFAPTGARVDFYDLRPFSSAAPSPVTGRAATPGTDRRCEVAYDGADVKTAATWIATALKQERLDQSVIDLPQGFSFALGVKHAAAVQLNPDRIAVTQIGTRPGPNGVETFLSVERLTSLSEGDP